MILLFTALAIVALACCLTSVCYRFSAREAEETVIPPWELGKFDVDSLLIENVDENTNTVSVVKVDSKHHKLKQHHHTRTSDEPALDSPHVWVMHEVDGPGARVPSLLQNHAINQAHPRTPHKGWKRLHKSAHQNHHEWSSALARNSPRSPSIFKPAVGSTTSFSQTVVQTLRKYGVRAELEPEHPKESEQALATAPVCIFILSNNFFYDERAVRQLKLAVQTGRTCLLVVMAGSRWGSMGEKTFPENAFNSSWTPYLPEVSPAFAEIAIAWEAEYPHACFEELITRVGAHLHRLTGTHVVDIPSMRYKLARAEERDLLKAARIAPSDVRLHWDWNAKIFDVFLSHKITDAKDVVLTWYNALSALGYHPFLDRLSLDAVENIPGYVRDTVTFAIAVTSNLWQSYWCAVELITATQWHAEGKLNILLIPVQGERYYDSYGDILDFPTPEIMMQNYQKWFPFGSMFNEEARRNIELLYGGGHYTDTRKITHTLLHYKSFERLFLARCGKSIAAHKAVQETVEAGGVTVEAQAESLTPFIFEANAIRTQKGEIERYAAKLCQRKSALGYENVADTSKLELRVVEMLTRPDDPNGLPVNIADYSPNEFVEILRQLRASSEALGLAVSKTSTAIEQWLLLEATDDSVLELLKTVAIEGVDSLQEICKSLVSFLQITGSLLLTFDIDWPGAIQDLVSFLRIFNLDFVSFDFVQAIMHAKTDYCTNTLAINYMFTLFLLSVPACYKFFLWKHNTHFHRREAFIDRCLYLVTLSCFLMYPVLALRTLRLFADRQFGEHKVIEVDWRLHIDTISVCRAQGVLFLFIYVLGIPLSFFTALRYCVRMQKKFDVTKLHGPRQFIYEKRNLRRFGILYAKYEERCWWYELVEVSRKLVLSGLIIFIAPGTVSQVWFALMASMFFLLLATFFMPYASQSINLFSTLSQLCTTLTLLTILSVRLELKNEGVLLDSATSPILVVLAVIPLVLALLLIGSAIYDLWLLQSKRSSRNKKLPAVMRDVGPNNKIQRTVTGGRLIFQRGFVRRATQSLRPVQAQHVPQLHIEPSESTKLYGV